MTSHKRDVALAGPVAVPAVAAEQRMVARENEEVVYDTEYDFVEEEGRVPSMEEDMANNPDRTRDEVKYARGLWASGMLEIHNSEEDEEEEENDTEYGLYSGNFGPHCRVFVAKAPICALSKRIQELAPHSRSWPVLEWTEITGPAPFRYWSRIEAIMKFVYGGKFNTAGSQSKFNVTESDIINWCLGKALKCPKLQNTALKAIMKRDSTFENLYQGSAVEESKVLSMIAQDDTHLMEDMGVVHKGSGEFQYHPLMSYLVDRLIWDALNGGYIYLKIVHQGSCIASMVARAQVDAAKKPKPRFAPWHPFNRHRCLISEDIKGEKKRTKDDGGRENAKKQRASQTSLLSRSLIEQRC